LSNSDLRWRQGKTCAENSEICAENSEIYAENSEICAENSVICAENSEIYAEDSEICAVNSEICAENSEIYAENSEIIDAPFSITYTPNFVVLTFMKRNNYKLTYIVLQIRIYHLWIRLILHKMIRVMPEVSSLLRCCLISIIKQSHTLLRPSTTP
jgi:hypothetical protein